MTTFPGGARPAPARFIRINGSVISRPRGSLRSIDLQVPAWRHKAEHQHVSHLSWWVEGPAQILALRLFVKKGAAWKRSNPELTPPALAQLDLLGQRAILQDAITAGMAEDEIVQNARPAERLSNQMLDAPRFCRVWLRLEVHGLVAEPAPVAVSRAKPVDFADVRRAGHGQRLAERN